MARTLAGSPNCSKLAAVGVRVSVVLVCCSIVFATAGVADAGRSQYGWLYGTEVLPERGAELQTWIHERNGRTDADVRETSLWWGALVGVTDHLELAFPAQFQWLRADEAPASSFNLERFGVEARYRFSKT